MLELGPTPSPSSPSTPGLGLGLGEPPQSSTKASSTSSSSNNINNTMLPSTTSTSLLPLLNLRMAYNAISNEIRDQQPEIIPHAASKMAAPAENHTTTTTTNNNMTPGVASYVEKAAEEDTKTKLMMEINDLKQLLGGRTAQVDSLSAEKASLQQKVNQLQCKLQELEHKCSNSSHNDKTATQVTGQSQFQSKVPPYAAPKKHLRKDTKVKFNTNTNTSPNACGTSVLNKTTATQDIPNVSYPSLADKDDEKNTHPTHAIIRRDILEAFTTVAPKFKEDEGGVPIRSKRKLTRQQRYVGFVGFRCRYCKDKPINKQANLAAIFPESISGIYRANIRFQSKHIEACPYIPKQLKDKLNHLKTTYKNSNRGKKTYWTKSALQKGFCDWQSPAGRNGIIYCPEPELK